MSLLDPIVPYLGPLGPALAVSGPLVVILGLIGIVSFMLYKVKRDIFETSIGWVGATVVLSLITILFRGMTYLCGCAWYYDTGGNPTALVPLTYMLITGSFFAIIYNFNIPPLKKHKWLISIPLSVPIAIVSNLFFPLIENGISSTPPLVFIEIAFLAPLGAIYSSFVYERAVLHMGDYHARLRRFLEQGQKGKKGEPGSTELPPEKQGFSYFTYGLLGRRIAKILPLFSGLKQVLSLAGMKIGYKAYVSSMIFSALVVGRIDLLGYDVLNAINAEVDRSPSTNYQDLLRGFGGVIRTGGDMKKFFQGITDHLFQKRSLQVQAFLDSLGIIAETYVLMLIAFPLMLVVMLSIMASIGGSLGGIDVFSFMYLMAFILIPICGVMFLFILDTMQPKG